MISSEKQVKSVVTFLSWFYLLSGIVLALLLIANFLLSNNFLTASFIGLLVPFSLFIGLKYRKPWLVPLIILVSSITLLSLVFTLVHNATFIVAKLVGMVLSLFELYFFTKKEVRNYFGTKGIFFFSR